MKLPKGFLASGVRAGIRKKRPDLGLIVAEDGANAAAVFTKNRFQAAPVVLSKTALKKSGGRVKAVVVNAGCANAVTGIEGTNAAKRVRTRTTAASFETSEKPNDAELFGAKLSHVCVTLSSSKRFLCGGPKRPNRVDENVAAKRNAIQFRWLATGRARSDAGITSIITCHKCRGSAQWLLL